MSAAASLPALPWHGGCQCGQLRYRLTGAPLTLYCCHCTECQKQSASMFGMSMIIRAAELEVTGETRFWTRPTDAGNTTDCHFCPVCGSRVWHQGSRRRQDGTLTLKGGTLDVAARLRPVGHIWLKSRQDGFEPPDDLLCYQAQPESYQPLIDAFALRYLPIPDRNPGSER